MSSKYKIDTELLISAIENKNCLWDLRSEDYKNKDIKRNAFMEVAAVVIKEYESLNEKEKNEAVSLIQTRWKTARDAYVRDRAKQKKLKSGDAAKQIKKYVYFENLSFLDRTLELNKTETNLDEGNRDELNVTESDVEQIIETPLEQSFTRKKRKKNDTLDDKLLEFLNGANKSEEDDDMAFFRSLLPISKTLNESQKMQFRSEVMRIVMEIKNIPPYQAQYVPRHVSSRFSQLNNIHNQSSGSSENGQ